MSVTCETEMSNYKDQLNICTASLSDQLSNNINIRNGSEIAVHTGSSYMQTIELLSKILGVMVLSLLSVWILSTIKSLSSTCKLTDFSSPKSWILCFPYIIPVILCLLGFLLVFVNANYSSTFSNEVQRQNTSNTTNIQKINMAIHACFIPTIAFILIYGIYKYNS